MMFDNAIYFRDDEKDLARRVRMIVEADRMRRAHEAAGSPVDLPDGSVMITVTKEAK